VFDQKGPSLKVVFVMLNKQFSFTTKCMIALQLVG